MGALLRRKTKAAPPYPLKDRTKPTAPWYHLTSRGPALGRPPCAHCPDNGGRPVPTYSGRPPRSDGLLAGEVRGRSFTGAYTSRSLSAHPDRPTNPVIAFWMIVHYLTVFSPVCQFLFLKFYILPQAERGPGQRNSPAAGSGPRGGGTVEQNLSERASQRAPGSVSGIDQLAAQVGPQDLDVLDGQGVHLEHVLVQHHKVGQLALLDASLMVPFRFSSKEA